MSRDYNGISCSLYFEEQQLLCKNAESPEMPEMVTLQGSPSRSHRKEKDIHAGSRIQVLNEDTDCIVQTSQSRKFQTKQKSNEANVYHLHQALTKFQHHKQINDCYRFK